MWPAKHSRKGQVGQREARDDEECKVVNVLMRAQNKRCRDCQCEVKPGFVGTPAERESHQDQQQDENDERHDLATAGNRFEDVAQRVDRGVGINELVGIR